MMGQRRVEFERAGVDALLPFPPRWRHGPGHHAWVLILLLPVLLMLPVGMVVLGALESAVDHVSFGAAAMVGLLGVLWVSVLWRSRWKGRRRPVLEVAGTAGLRWRESRFHWVLMVVAHWAMTLLCPVFAWAVWTEAGMDPSEEKLLLSSVAALTAWGAWNVVSIARGRARRGEVLLTHQGLEYRPRARTHFVAWEMLQVDGNELAARAVQPEHAPGGPVIRVRRRRSVLSLPQRMLMMTFVGDPSRPLFVHVSTLAGDPVQLLHALAWYAQHPERRVELADGRALARVSEGRAVVPELLGGEE